MKKLKPNLVEQLNAAHHLNALSDSNPAAFNFVSKVIYEQSPGIVTPAEIQAAAEFIDDVMKKRRRIRKSQAGAFDEQFETLTVKEAAAELGLSVESIQKFIRTGQLPAQKLADVWTVYQADVESLKDRKTKPGPAKRT